MGNKRYRTAEEVRNRAEEAIGVGKKIPEGKWIKRKVRKR